MGGDPRVPGWAVAARVVALAAAACMAVPAANLLAPALIKTLQISVGFVG